MQLPTTRHAWLAAWLVMHHAIRRRPTSPPLTTVTTLVLTGDIDADATRRLEHTARCLRRGARLQLDLSGVSWIGAAGIRLLQRWHADPALTMTIACCSPAVRRTAAHANLLAMLPATSTTARTTLQPAA